jgi:hypothetical protein
LGLLLPTKLAGYTHPGCPPRNPADAIPRHPPRKPADTHPTPVSSKEAGGCHTPAFCEKSVQAVENKGRGRCKSAKERHKSAQVDERARVARFWLVTRDRDLRENERKWAPPLGFCMDVKTGELRKKGFVKV